MGALALVALASCAGPRLDVDDVLAADPASPAGIRSEFIPPEEFDARASRARTAALESPEDVAALVAASRALFLAADSRVQRAALDHLDALESPNLEDVLRADDGVSSELRAEVESLVAEGLDLAERAVARAPRDRGALLYRAINTSLLAWSVGESRALFEGLGGDCKRAMAACLAESETYEGAAPLRLRGRFLSKAPWPLGDEAEAVELLRRATELAPVTLNWLFLGDALHERGQASEAREAWRLAAAAESDPGSAALGAYHREFARRRVELSR